MFAPLDKAGILREQFPRNIIADTSDILARMLVFRGCYEKTAAVEFQLYSLSRQRYTIVTSACRNSPEIGRH